MAAVTAELEITSSVPAPKIFHAFVLDFDNLVPKILPQAFKSVEILHGDGGVGTIKHVAFGEGVPFTSVKHKVEGLDKENFTYSFTIIEGDILIGILESVTYHIKIVPSADGGSTLKHKTVYNCKGDASQITEEHIKFGHEELTRVFKAVEAHLLANPSAY